MNHVLHEIEENDITLLTVVAKQYQFNEQIFCQSAVIEEEASCLLS